MDNNDNENAERRNSNTEYLPTKCRITKPPPPKPATNPLQFVKVAPCPLFQKAHEQIKKVEEVKKERKEVREEAEDWQANLDNWKSSRRKRQEHIIERVVEVKKLEQEEHDRHRRKSKTFSEMIEDRSRGRHKFNIPIYDDDSNDLSDYGIGSSSSKTNSIKDFDTDDSCSILDEKDNHSFESPCNKDLSSASNQSQSEDETNNKSDSANANTYTNNCKSKPNNVTTENNKPEFTYEGAIQDYRSRIRSKIHVDESIFVKNEDNARSKEFSEAQTVVPKGEICKRKELFEVEKPLEISNFESLTSRRLSEDFVNTQSIKQRLQSLEKCTDQNLKVDKSEIKNRKESTNNNNNDNKSRPTKISSFLVDKSNIIFETKNNNVNLECKNQIPERCSSPETELYMDQLNMFNKDLDNLMSPTKSRQVATVPVVESHSNIETLSDREDSGVHTADVSASVSQESESLKYTELASECLAVQVPNEEPISFVTSTELTIASDKMPEENAVVEASPEIPDKISSKICSQQATVQQPSNPIDFITGDEIILDTGFSLAPPQIEPPKVKPPPPPPPAEDEPSMKRLNSTKRIKREIHIKRSNFLGLDEPTDDQIYPDLNVNRPPDINTFLQKESKLEKTLYKKTQEENRMGKLSKVESHDSGLDIDRGRLSSDTWCSSIGDSNTPSPERQDSEQTNSITSEEDEITKKEREIIEMIEKEEKSRDGVEFISPPREKRNGDSYLKNGNFNKQYFGKESSSFIDDQDSEVMKVEHELRQLEKEELERQRENILFQESRAKLRLQNNRHSMENIFDEIYPSYPDGVDYRKSMPELQHIAMEYRKSLPEVPNNVYGNVYRPAEMQHRKSMPDIQHAYYKSVPESLKIETNSNPMDHRKSMPELQRDIQMSAFKVPPPSVKKQPIMPGKPLRPLTKEQKERFLMMNPGMSDALIHTKPRQLSRHNLQSLNAVPMSRHHPVENWIQPRAKTETKSYNQHWLYQEAELRRISEQQKNAAANRNNWQQYNRQEKHLPDSVIHKLTQRVQNRTEITDRNQSAKRPDGSPNKDNVQQHPYLGHSPTMGHALPMPYSPPVNMEETQDRMLSVSGKKKCSYCNNELGRGAAMIIESLCLFYHMECFKCCVCHVQLGDGLMGTDVRVRNQKLHCHNCYSSDDGIKFSCV